MKIKAILIKLNDGSFLSADSCQSTRDKYKAIISTKMLPSKLRLLDDGSYTLCPIDVNVIGKCEVGCLEFNYGDTFSFSSVDGCIIHQTEKYVWTAKYRGNEIDFSSVEKHAKKDHGTRSFKTGQGYKIA